MFRPVTHLASRALRRLAAIVLLSLGIPGLPTAFAQSPVTVLAAASLTNAYEDVGRLFREKTGRTVRFSFAASSTLARQIEAGAPANVFASADEQWMDWVQQRNLIVRESRRATLANALVLVTAQDRNGKIELKPGFDLAGLLGANGRLVTGDPAHVPVGRYAQEALTKLGVWDIAESRLVRADSVRAALALVERGEAPAGIVYATDAAISAKVRVAGVFPESSHAPIVYPVALVAKRDTPEAKRFFEFLASEEALAIYRKHGFVVKAR